MEVFNMSIGRLLIIMGITLVVVGLVLTFWQKIPLIGRLPGDIYFERGNFRFYFPIVTSILLSLILTLIFHIVSRISK